MHRMLKETQRGEKKTHVKEEEKDEEKEKEKEEEAIEEDEEERYDGMWRDKIYAEEQHWE